MRLQPGPGTAAGDHAPMPVPLENPVADGTRDRPTGGCHRHAIEVDHVDAARPRAQDLLERIGSDAGTRDDSSACFAVRHRCEVGIDENLGGEVVAADLT